MSELEERQKELLHLLEFPTLPTKTKFSIAVGRNPEWQGIGVLGRGRIFSTFRDEHLSEANQLAELLIGAGSFDDFLDICHEARDFVNQGIYTFALSVAILNRPDCRGVSLPPVEKMFPDKFIPVQTLFDAYKRATTVPPEQEVIVDVEATGNVKDPEYQLSYYREDIGINAHHWYWHIVYPSTWRGKKKDRKGELFYYMHQQMCARYDSERLSNGMPRVVAFHNFEEPLDGYSAHLSCLINGLPYSSRPDGTKLVDLPDINVQDVEYFKMRILDAIESGYVIDEHGNEVFLDPVHGIDILGAIIESSYDSPNKKFYGSLHNWGHVLIANVLDPNGKFEVNPGVMDDATTSLRDPIFYRWHRFIDDVFQEHLKRIAPYTEDERAFSGVHIERVTVKALHDNQITTTIVDDLLDVTDGVYFARPAAVKDSDENEKDTFYSQLQDILNSVKKRDISLVLGDFNAKVGTDSGLWAGVLGPFGIGSYNGNGERLLQVRYHHMDHEPFSYEIVVTNSSPKIRLGTCRIFLAPKYDELGNELEAADLRRLMIELDKFRVDLQPGSNVIHRNASDSSVTIPRRSSGDQLVHIHHEGDDEEEAVEYCNCGWPEHLLVPQGNVRGMEFHLFVMISNYLNDVINPTEKGKSKKKHCSDAISYCGSKDESYPDRQSMGFPFDRYFEEHVDYQKWLLPNMSDTIINIVHHDPHDESVQ